MVVTLLSQRRFRRTARDMTGLLPYQRPRPHRRSPAARHTATHACPKPGARAAPSAAGGGMLCTARRGSAGKSVRRERLWELNGEPMETAGEVIANVGVVMEHLDREIR